MSTQITGDCQNNYLFKMAYYVPTGTLDLAYSLTG